jgi:hypothetical protein
MNMFSKSECNFTDMKTALESKFGTEKAPLKCQVDQHLTRNTIIYCRGPI